MATKVATAIACDNAAQRIEGWAATHVTEGLTPLPRVHKDREILRKIQLETIADWLDRATVDRATPDSKLQDAIALLDGNWTKSEMEEILRG
ncbi:MAG: hypothetical protein ACPG7F_15815 [Aggregatilineales bacterium]